MCQKRSRQHPGYVHDYEYYWVLSSWFSSPQKKPGKTKLLDCMQLMSPSVLKPDVLKPLPVNNFRWIMPALLSHLLSAQTCTHPMSSSPNWPEYRIICWRNQTPTYTATWRRWKLHRKSMECQSLEASQDWLDTWDSKLKYTLGTNAILVSHSRWVRLLFGREFPMQDLLMLWDAIFADSISFDLVDYIFVAMLLYIREASKWQQWSSSPLLSLSLSQSLNLGKPVASFSDFVVCTQLYHDENHP